MFVRLKLSLLPIITAVLLCALTRPVIAAPLPPRARPGDPASIWSQAGKPRNLQFQALPLERSKQNHLLLRARINGKPALLGIDSGAPVSAIAINRVQHFGLTEVNATSEVPRRLRINGAYNRVAIARTLQLGALSLLDEPMVAVDLGGSSRAAKLMNEQAIDGIIGADILFPPRRCSIAASRFSRLRSIQVPAGAHRGRITAGLRRCRCISVPGIIYMSTAA